MVDDEPDINFTIKATLQETGLFQVDTFNDAESALSIFRPGLYDLALLDIRLPEMNGFQLCRKLREIDNRLKICFLTATDVLYYRQTDSDIVNDLGTDCFVSKPVNTSDLVLSLKTILSQETNQMRPMLQIDIPAIVSLSSSTSMTIMLQETEPAASTTPTIGADSVAIRHEPEIKGGLKALRDKGMKITHYEEHIPK